MFNLNITIKCLLSTIYKGKVLHNRQTEMFAKTGKLLGFFLDTFYNQTKSFTYTIYAKNTHSYYHLYFFHSFIKCYIFHNLYYVNFPFFVTNNFLVSNFIKPISCYSEVN